MVELSDRLTDAEALLALQARQLRELEATQASSQQPDHSAALAEIRDLLRKAPPPEDFEALTAQLGAVQHTLSAIPRALPVEHHHHMEDSARWFIIGGLVLLLITALATGLCFSLYRENSRLEGRDVQYRLLGLYYPEATHWADSVYRSHPGNLRTFVEQEEARQGSLTQAEALAKRKEEEAREAARQVEKLRQDTP
ncbi:hypothetical protein [Pontibacter litorisediminis]|uniref:hypothetical protein n=1 Tax=Pontibacter litorisediminis TaxID=1846260 RepID=UPI0023EC114D|nr:hypothetical protein [Pontibacter litorisediminis]